MVKTLIPLFVLFPFLTTAQITDKSDENKIFEKVETDAAFPGGPAKWKEFVKNNFNFSPVEKDLPDSVTSFSDTAKIQFVVDRNGIINNITFQNMVSKKFKESCIQLFKDSPHWRPANQCGRNVNAYRKQTFIVQIDKTTGKKLIIVRG